MPCADKAGLSQGHATDRYSNAELRRRRRLGSIRHGRSLQVCQIRPDDSGPALVGGVTYTGNWNGIEWNRGNFCGSGDVKLIGKDIEGEKSI
jgi:hypothetical protein